MTPQITYQLGGELAPPGVVGIYETRAGSYWVNTVGGLYRFRSDAFGLVTYGVADGLKTAWLSTIEESPDGSLYITNGSVKRRPCVKLFFFPLHDTRLLDPTRLVSPICSRSCKAAV